MRSLKISLIGLALAMTIVVQHAVLAATTTEQTADPVLTDLYLQELRETSPSAALETRITNQRARVRQEELKTLNAMVDAANTDSTVNAPSTTANAPILVTTAQQDEQALVDALQSKRQETKADHDLLLQDEATLDKNAVVAKGAVLDGILRRKADLLSRKAVYEERLAAIDTVLTEQQDRLNLLLSQARRATFVDAFQVGIYIAIFLLVIILERVIRGQLIERIRDRNRRYLVSKIFTGCVYIIGIIWILYHISGTYPGFVTPFAIIGAGIAVALQSVVKDMMGWMLIVQKRLFTLGQRVTIGPYTGDIADISLLRTTLVEVNNADKPDVARVGQTLYLPNSIVLEQPVLNFHATSDFIEAEVPVTVTYTSDWKKVEETLQQILDEEVGEYVESARRQHIRRTLHFFAAQEPSGPRVFVDLAENGILFTLRFQIPIGHRRSIVSRITRKILERFAAMHPPVALAYNTLQIVQSKSA